MTKTYRGNHIFNIVLGVIGLALLCAGTLTAHIPEIQRFLFLFGALLMTISSYLEKNVFFTFLEGILTIDAILSFTSLSNIAIGIITFIIVVVVIIYFTINGSFKERYLIVGTIGLFFLALGVGILNPISCMIGGFLLIIYAYMAFKKGIQIAFLFIILNIIFTITAAIGTYQWLF